MQISSFVHAAAVALSLASMLAAASVAYADAPSSSQALAAQPATTQAPAVTSNTGPYDGSDFVVPESQIFS